MQRKTNLFSIRLTDNDFAKMNSEMTRLGFNASDYIRFLIRLAPSPGDKTGCLIVDVHDLYAMKGELVRWGYHYNQAVRFLNTIRFKMDHGQLNTAECRQLLLSCEANLQKVDAGRSKLSSEITALQEKVLVG